MSKKGPGKQDREAIPAIIDEFGCGESVLQIGARQGGSWKKIKEVFFKHGAKKHDILEAWPSNVNNIKRRNKDIGGHVFEGDVLKIKDINGLKDNTYDWIVWWHGPEHVLEKDFKKILPTLIKMVNIGIIIGCPFGNCPQGKSGDNPFEEHVSHFTDEKLEKLGFTIYKYGEKNKGTLSGYKLK